MAWSTPRTWSTSELVTSSMMNEHVRDQFLEIAKLGFYRCWAYASSGQTVTAGNTSALTLDSEVHDPQGMHSTSSNTSRITVPVTGGYRVNGRAEVTSNNNGTPTLHLRRNGSTVTPTVNGGFATAAGNFEDQTLSVFAHIILTANDYVELAGQAVTQDFVFTAQLSVEGLTYVV